MNIFPELLNIHATLIADFPKSGSASFQGMDSYVRRWSMIWTDFFIRSTPSNTRETRPFRVSSGR
ncbi:MAG: hypothetical protein WAU84_09790, partial [Thermoguttaceae bacterium]